MFKNPHFYKNCPKTGKKNTKRHFHFCSKESWISYSKVPIKCVAATMLLEPIKLILNPIKTGYLQIDFQGSG